MARTTIASLDARVNALTAAVEALTAALAATSAPAAPAQAASPEKPHTWASKAEREAGGGFACECGRTGLRTAPKAGSFHKRPDGTLHTLA